LISSVQFPSTGGGNEKQISFKWLRQITLLTIIGMTMVTTVYAETELGRMTALQAFHDTAIAEWVTAVEHEDYAKADRLLARGAQVNMVGEEESPPCCGS
jgi:hypothetical protein